MPGGPLLDKQIPHNHRKKYASKLLAFEPQTSENLVSKPTNEMEKGAHCGNGTVRAFGDFFWKREFAPNFRPSTHMAAAILSLFNAVNDGQYIFTWHAGFVSSLQVEPLRTLK